MLPVLANATQQDTANVKPSASCARSHTQPFSIVSHPKAKTKLARRKPSKPQIIARSVATLCHLQKAKSKGPGAENGGSSCRQAITQPSFHILWSGLFWALVRERRMQKTQVIWSPTHLPSHKSNSSRTGQLHGNRLVY